ncbi:hypothetical protein OIU77_013641 [Salix suchowensis]|uniref:Uncharacterized protein n=1 Tax=Salix suchowensis TaxID=1278906 RepID=A0ABQ8ZVC3_9ROSI|nr:hypothetical protein OIU77_013641 [Salix suchowensis]
MVMGKEVQLGVHQAFDLPTTNLRNREVVEIARRPIFSKGGSTSSVCISMKPSFDLQLKSGSPPPRHSEAVSSSTDEAFKKWL